MRLWYMAVTVLRLVCDTVNYKLSVQVNYTVFPLSHANLTGFWSKEISKIKQGIKLLFKPWTQAVSYGGLCQASTNPLDRKQVGKLQVTCAQSKLLAGVCLGNWGWVLVDPSHKVHRSVADG